MVNTKLSNAYKQPVTAACMTEINLINQVLGTLLHEKIVANNGLQIATISKDAKLISYWQDQLMDLNAQISRLEQRLKQTQQQCSAMTSSANKSGYFSSYCDADCVTNSLNQALTDCNTGNGSDWSQDSDPGDCYAASEQVIRANAATQNAGQSPPTTGTSTTTTSGGGFMGSVTQVLNFAKGLFGGSKTTTAGGTPPPLSSSSTVIGLTPALGVSVILIGTAAAVWGVYALIKYANKPGKTPTVVAA